MKTFKSLNLGAQRCLVVGLIIAPIISMFIFCRPRDYFDLDDKDFWEPVLWAIPVYLVLVRLALYIIDGFRKKEGEL